ncbi:MAG: PorT family protein [Bacteroidales bacterium]|nr:PorT family protein [Bacteroidales bacterium]
MKRLIPLIAIMLGISGANAFAQNFFSPTDEPTVMNDGPKAFISIGPTVGATLSNLSKSSDAYNNFGFRVGFSAGGFLNIRFLSRNVRSTAETGVLAFQPECHFTMIGGNSSDSNLGLSYITVPLMIQVYPAANFYIEAGPSIGLNIAHTPDNIVISSTEFNLANLKANDVAIAFGIGYRFGKLGAGARYYMGLSDLAPNMPWKNRWFEISISYAIPLTKQHTSLFDD